MKKALTKIAHEPAPITGDATLPMAAEPECAAKDFPFRLIKNENYRPVRQPKKRITINDKLPPAA
jgi:hypothetical protein